MPTTATPPAYRSYLLRLWRTASGQWRASLEAAQTGELRAFGTLEQLAAFLAQATEAEPGKDSPEGGHSET